MNAVLRTVFLRSLIPAGVLFLYLIYFALVVLKTPFDFSDPDYEVPWSAMVHINMVLANEPSDHFRSASAALLLGLLAGNMLAEPSAAGRRRMSIAILLASGLLAVSTFFGITSLASPLILWLIALYGAFVGLKGLSGPKSEANAGHAG